MLLRMAWRNVWRNRARSLTLISSVAVGLFAGVFVLAIYQGLLKVRVRTVIRDEVSHLQIHHPLFRNDYEAIYTLPGIEKLEERLRTITEIEQSSSRSIAEGMLATGTGSNGIEIRGVDPVKEAQVSNLNEKVFEGDYFDKGLKNQILIGGKLANKMKLELNNKVVLSFTDKDNNVISGAFRIKGFYQSTNTPLDERIVYVKRQELNPLLAIGRGAHEMAILLKTDDSLDAVQIQLQKMYPQLSVQNWKQLSPETEMSVATVNQFSLIIIIIIMLALAFGIVNTMLMAILERRRETGMMMALGMNQFKVFSVILLETVFLTFAGLPVGLLLAWGLSLYTGSYGINISSFAKEAMSSFGYGSIIYPEFPLQHVLEVLLIVIVTALLSAIFPAIKALSMPPVEALKK